MAKADAADVKEDKPKQAAVNKTPEPERKVRNIEGNAIAECEFKRTLYVATCHEGTIPEDLEKPDYWTNVAERLKPWDKIEARAYDGTWYAEGVVLEASRRWAKVDLHLIRHYTTSDVSLTQAKLGEYEVSYGGPGPEWRVIRKSDREELSKNHGSKDSAYLWLSERVRSGL